jgi:ABC-type uncharacterized transport system substrate-binding protein
MHNAVFPAMLPHAKTIATLINSDFGPSGRFQADVDEAARALGLSIQQMQASNEREIDHAFDILAMGGVDALLVGPGPFLDSQRQQLVTLAAKIGIPAGYETRATALAGGLTIFNHLSWKRIKNQERTEIERTTTNP